QMLQAVVELGSLPAPWLEAGRIERLLPRVDEAERRLNEMQVARAALEAEFSDGITDVVDHEMRVRYRTDWQGFFRRLGGAYRRDDRLLRGYLKRPRKLSLEEALDLIERVMKVKKLEEEWKLDARQFEEEFGTRFQAADTSWRNLRRDLKRTRGLLSEGRLDSWCLRQVLAGSGVNRELREAAGRVQQTHERVGRGLQELAISTDLIEGGTVDELFASIEACVPLLDRITLAAEPLEGLITPEAEDLESVRRACEQSLELDQLEHEISKRAGSHRADFGARFNGLDTPWNDIARVLDWCERLLLLAGYENDDALQAHRIKALAAQASAPRGRDELAATEEGIRANIDVFVSELAPVALRFDESASPWGEWRKAPFEELERWTRDLETRAGSAADWIDYRRACLELENVLGDGLVDRIRDVSGDASLIPPIVLRRIWLAWIEHSFSQEPALAIAAADLQGIEADFSRWDRELPNIARARVRERAFSSYPETHSTSLRAGQLGTLRGELSKRRRQLPVRSLVTRIPGLLQVLKPCFLMSPLSVSQYLPRAERDRRGLEFDVVVFDEASQIFPEDAVPAIARAAQVIVVGDQQQLPPTQFFRAASSADVELEPQESSASQEAEPEDRFLGRESILDVMVGLAGQGVAAEYLTVHYRSQHSDLIRYSNHYFYGDRLFTFPGAARDDLHLGVHGRYLEDGLFDAGGSRTNRREAEVVVERVFELMRARPFQESIGVVTLSRTQADLIETLIAQRRRGEREFDERFALDLPERFFVKNLENVQGDERDHILLSLGYGPSEIGGTVANRFGPINQPGGERRLNVAVSRARRSMTVVHSMRPDQVTAQNEGARLLRSFLEFVHDPNSATSDEAAQRPAGDRHALVSAGVRAALEDAGHHVEERVGVAGYFIDLALRSEEGAGQYEIGLELDGPQCYATPAARDRDRLRPAVLGALGWTLYRLRATSWIRDPEGELARIEQAIAAARSQREQEAQGLADSQPMGRGAPDAPQLDTDQAEASGIDRAKAIGIDRAKAIGIDRAKAIGIDRVDAGGINQVDAAVSSESKSDPEAEARSSAQSGSAASIAASGESNTDHKGSAAEDEAPEGDAAIDDPADEGLLVPYLSAQLEDLAGKSELSEEDDLSWLRLTHRIVEAEGPIHRDLVFDRLRENFGSPRSTPKLRTRFDKALQMGLRGEQFEWLPKTDEDEDPNSFLVGKGAPSIVGRRPKAGEAARNIKLVAGQELEAALLRVVDALFGASDEDALGECARQLGYQRMGPAIARRLEAARDRLLASGSLVRQFDSLTCVTPSR
ncbi:MAG: very-short-patch-repair endonuclease, partial [Planctomycetota bacterium]